MQKKIQVVAVKYYCIFNVLIRENYYYKKKKESIMTSSVEDEDVRSSE